MPDRPRTNWSVYIILSSDDRLYTGITTDIKKRWHAHCHTQQGAKFFRGRSPKKLLYVETDFDRSSASQREAAIKKLSRTHKLALIAQQSEINWHNQLNLPQS
ncbi:GIY-YIG nuclease family protein [Aestuariicella sp. G3-2]|uniref:GIY-YIG nuclease family protein n=1 Tax=Pseudomaricurvus albidus TaxID=2842452 RepID=UPI001C0AD658|nr:GIY-YIG nuclease family protein [Aestuariicella albida]MBU3069949.1 GIY-YIG nuclease family protein [Aestuariicella albida]